MQTQYGQILVLAIAFAPCAYAGDLRGYRDFAGTLNHASSVEGAESHGGLGLKLGLGMTVATLPGQELVGKENFYRSDDPDASTVVMPTIMVVKGLSVPVDLALVTAFLENRRISQIAGLAQWTVFEGFALPAIALRGGLQRMYGLAASTVESLSLDFVASYGVSYFTFYGSYGEGWHKAHIEDDGGLEARWDETTYGMGIRITIVPPFVSLSFEGRTGEGDTNVYAVKLAFGH